MVAVKGSPPWWDVAGALDERVMPASVRESAGWYRRHMVTWRLLSQAADVAILVLSAAVPVAVAVGGPTWLQAALGASAAVVTGVRQAFGWHRNWPVFARTSALIEAEIVEWSVSAGDYAGLSAPQQNALLALRVSQIAQAETVDWSKHKLPQEPSPQHPGGGAPHQV